MRRWYLLTLCLLLVAAVTPIAGAAPRGGGIPIKVEEEPWPPPLLWEVVTENENPDPRAKWPSHEGAVVGGPFPDGSDADTDPDQAIGLQAWMNWQNPALPSGPLSPCLTENTKWTLEMVMAVGPGSRGWVNIGRVHYCTRADTIWFVEFMTTTGTQTKLVWGPIYPQDYQYRILHNGAAGTWEAWFYDQRPGRGWFLAGSMSDSTLGFTKAVGYQIGGESYSFYGEEVIGGCQSDNPWKAVISHVRYRANNQWQDVSNMSQLIEVTGSRYHVLTGEGAGYWMRNWTDPCPH
jgi:hypothetical protein